MSHEHGFIIFEMSVLADGKFIPNLIFHIIQKDYKCLKTVKCSNFISKHRFITRKGNYSWLSGVVTVKAGTRTTAEKAY